MYQITFIIATITSLSIFWTLNQFCQFIKELEKIETEIKTL